MNNDLVELVLTCGSWQEAQRIADALLEKRLVTTVETFDIRPTHWWDHHTHGTKEVKVIVMASAENLPRIRSLADKLHRTKTAPVLLTAFTK